jgi:hypothetical protein
MKIKDIKKFEKDFKSLLKKYGLKGITSGEYAFVEGKYQLIVFYGEDGDAVLCTEGDDSPIIKFDVR